MLKKSTESAQVQSFYQLSRKSKPVLGISSGFPLLFVTTVESPMPLKTVCESATKMFSIEAEILVVGALAGGAGGGTLALVVVGCFGAGT